MTTDEDWKSTVRYKLSNVFEEDVQTLFTILSYLDEDYIGDKSTTKAEVWEILTSSLEADDFFESYARSLVQDRILEDTDPDKDSKSLEEVKSVPDSYEENLAAGSLEDNNEDLENDVLRKVVEVFKDDREICANILFNLNKENKIFTGDKLHQVWQTLKENLTSEEHFKYYARLLVDDITETEDETVVDVPDILNQLPTDDQEEYFDIEESKAEIRSKLLDVFQEAPKTLEKILCYLDKEDVIHQDITKLSQVWESLKSNLHSDNLFMTYARSLVEDEEESCKKSGNFGNLDGDEAIAFANDTDDSKAEIRCRLLDEFHDDAETLDKIFCHLDEEDAIYECSPTSSHGWKSLKLHLNSVNLFKKCAKSLVQDQPEVETCFDNGATARDDMESLETDKFVKEDVSLESYITDWTDDVKKKVIEIFEKEPETLTRILFYLDQESEAYNDASVLTPVWKTLKHALPSDKLFKDYANRLADDTRRAEKDEKYRATMNVLYQNMLVVSDAPVSGKKFQGFDLEQFKGLKSGVVKVWEMIPAGSIEKILEMIPKLVETKDPGDVDLASQAVTLVDKNGPLVVVVLATAYLAYEVITDLDRWWKGEITGQRCVKNIIDSLITAAAGAAGCVLGAKLGSKFAGPWGTVIGGVLGGVISSQGASFLSNRLTQLLFGIPKDEALENAYKFLGVKMTASNHEINTAFHRLCLKHHPDKGGKAEDFHELQVNMGVIKAAREEI